MGLTAPHASDARPSTTATCSRCGRPAQVPFTPTLGRPLYCDACFAARRNAPSRGPASRPQARPRQDLPPPKRMLSYGRKGHFVHDALQALDQGGSMDEPLRRSFVEMVFTRGARQDTRSAIGFVREKQAEGPLSQEEADALVRLLERYSLRR